MAAKGERPIRTIIIGVITAVATAIVLAALGLNGGGGSGSSSTAVVTPVQPAYATTCATSFGSCPVVIGMPRGSVCTCYNAFGMAVASGVAQ